MAAERVEVEHVEGSGRFVARRGGAEAGYAEYVREDGAVRVTHTVVDPEHEGHGVGSALVRAVLTDARAQGAAVLPQCTFVRAHLQRHPDDLPLVPEGRRAEFGLG